MEITRYYRTLATIATGKEKARAYLMLSGFTTKCRSTTLAVEAVSEDIAAIILSRFPGEVGINFTKPLLFAAAGAVQPETSHPFRRDTIWRRAPVSILPKTTTK